MVKYTLIKLIRKSMKMRNLILKIKNKEKMKKKDVKLYKILNKIQK